MIGKIHYTKMLERKLWNYRVWSVDTALVDVID